MGIGIFYKYYALPELNRNDKDHGNVLLKPFRVRDSSEKPIAVRNEQARTCNG